MEDSSSGEQLSQTEILFNKSRDDMRNRFENMMSYLDKAHKDNPKDWDTVSVMTDISSEILTTLSKHGF